VIIYKDKSKSQISQELREKCPNGVDYFMDCVGGEISAAVFNCMNRNAKFCCVGQISQYNTPDFQFGKISDEIESIIKEKEIQKQSFLVSQKEEYYEEGFNTLLKLLKDGKIKHKETVYEGIKNWPDAFVDLFNGTNVGKTLVRVDKS